MMTASAAILEDRVRESFPVRGRSGNLGSNAVFRDLVELRASEVGGSSFRDVARAADKGFVSFSANGGT